MYILTHKFSRSYMRTVRLISEIDATDATSSTRHKENCATLGNGKFDIFGPRVPLLTKVK